MAELLPFPFQKLSQDNGVNADDINKDGWFFFNESDYSSLNYPVGYGMFINISISNQQKTQIIISVSGSSSVRLLLRYKYSGNWYKWREL